MAAGINPTGVEADLLQCIVWEINHVPRVPQPYAQLNFKLSIDVSSTVTIVSAQAAAVSELESHTESPVRDIDRRNVGQLSAAGMCFVVNDNLASRQFHVTGS